jgi:hypothetical protein
LDYFYSIRLEFVYKDGEIYQDGVAVYRVKQLHSNSHIKIVGISNLPDIEINGWTVSEGKKSNVVALLLNTPPKLEYNGFTYYLSPLYKYEDTKKMDIKFEDLKVGELILGSGQITMVYEFIDDKFPVIILMSVMLPYIKRAYGNSIDVKIGNNRKGILGNMYKYALGYCTISSLFFVTAILLMASAPSYAIYSSNSTTIFLVTTYMFLFFVVIMLKDDKGFLFKMLTSIIFLIAIGLTFYDIAYNLFSKYGDFILFLVIGLFFSFLITRPMARKVLIRDTSTYISETTKEYLNIYGDKHSYLEDTVGGEIPGYGWIVPAHDETISEPQGDGTWYTHIVHVPDTERTTMCRGLWGIFSGIIVAMAILFLFFENQLHIPSLYGLYILIIFMIAFFISRTMGRRLYIKDHLQYFKEQHQKYMEKQGKKYS